jgi:hypothetical protein
MKVQNDIPIGELLVVVLDISGNILLDDSNSNVRPFEEWLVELWREKDQLLEQYLHTGSFPGSVNSREIVQTIPLRLRHKLEMLQVMGLVGPLLFAWCAAKYLNM